MRSSTCHFLTRKKTRDIYRGTQWHVKNKGNKIDSEKYGTKAEMTTFSDY